MTSNLDAETTSTASADDRPQLIEAAPALTAADGGDHPPVRVTSDVARSSRSRRGLASAAAIPVLAVILQGLLVALFAWPAINMAPRDLPIVVAAPPDAAGAIVERLNAIRPGAFKISTVANEAEAAGALRERQAYAAFVVRPEGPRVLVASAASPLVAQLITQQAQALGSGQPVSVVDVVTSDPDDPRGAGFAAGFLPLVLTSMVAGILLALLVSVKGARLAATVAFAVLAGLAGAAVLQYWLGALPAHYLPNAAVIGLLALAVSATVTGLAALLGPAGAAIAVILTFLLGNPLSAAASAPEMLPQPWGAIGQLLPPGAGATLLRSTAFFDGAGGMPALWTLVAWAAAGITMLLVGRHNMAGHRRAGD